MQISDTAFKRNFILYIAAVAVTLGFISLLQFVPTPWFFAVLIAMHGGVLFIIVSKKRFKRAGFSVSQFYNAQYIFLLPYLLIMLHVFAAKAGVLPPLEELKTTMTLTYTVLCAAMTTWNCIRMKKALDHQRVLIAKCAAKAKQAIAPI